ncbi:hypothetical protein TUMSATVNIG1_60570 (plasmid) [Vibrio nigripulchritudo]|uniref:hypothetical protein n=1 Tax=Vibrio nigripulchritudo TaxID=28173 RepID=UPI0019090668|nr:hypothetical protein [Vibrio nigripulchritudo]BCL74072.1 hypothetical protein VNTUMSATTG_60090 [Vibrio nigripulchritudo]BDU35448.1 hypothetical protein TUMSATVNIG1_60570 [Vibrio nigripulchritudo]
MKNDESHIIMSDVEHGYEIRVFPYPGYQGYGDVEFSYYSKPTFTTTKTKEGLEYQLVDQKRLKFESPVEIGQDKPYCVQLMAVDDTFNLCISKSELESIESQVLLPHPKLQ